MIFIVLGKTFANELKSKFFDEFFVFFRQDSLNVWEVTFVLCEDADMPYEILKLNNIVMVRNKRFGIEV